STIPLSTTWTAGATPTYMSAPGLPNLATVIGANYPPMDVTPPTDSPEVQQWIQEVANSGIPIPDFNVTVAGGCPANPEAVAEAEERCWWTCSTCTRTTDVTTCPDKFTWGVTYDDGPSVYSTNLLQYLDAHDIKATFFSIGSRALGLPASLQEEYMAGHQIGVHTWSHPQLTTKTNEEIIAELGWTKKLIKDIIGVTPNTMRPPYGDIDDRVRNISLAMGLTPVIWTRISATATFDTNDFSIPGGLATPQQVIQNWNNILGNASQIDTGFIVLEHDLFAQTVDMATGYILPDALAFQPNLTLKPVISCLNKPMSDAYIELNDNSTNPPAASGGPATLSSGAPGSAENTDGASSSSASATGGSGSSAAIALTPGSKMAVATAAFGVLAGFVVVLL
ncbi:glycoside hydrolase/deacetylase, partial [Punctularia strigosozonata HHB-11173 SS5]|uniref:glycoside hydrolase/deacetylase n=1 Tax=Punctularia strigosozonata (strain HHB-11173) TaxID=741275 RepID=UPI0004417243